MKQKVKNMMANVTEKYADFFSEITNEYPEVAKTNQVSRKQILDWLDSSKSKVSVPWGYLLNNKVKKGLYSIPGGNISTAPNSVSESTAPVVVDSLDPSSLIPKRDTNYVPFGNYRDLEVILTSKMFYPVYVSGPTGNGKSTTIEQICAKHKRPLI